MLSLAWATWPPDRPWGPPHSALSFCMALCLAEDIDNARSSIIAIAWRLRDDFMNDKDSHTNFILMCEALFELDRLERKAEQPEEEK